MIGFGNKDYWNKRYQEEGEQGSFDWLLSYESLKPNLQPFLTSKDISILIVGCGNAPFSEDLYDAGYVNITNNDISQVVIDIMSERNKEKRPKMKWLVMDATDMKEFANDTFDIVIDKSTHDAIICGDDNHLKLAQLHKEYLRVLKVGGINS